MTIAGLTRRSRLSNAVLMQIGAATNRTFVLPLLIFYPTSRCNSRCASCDWWHHDGADDLTAVEIAEVARSLPALGTRVVAFSGGEPLVRSDLAEIATMFKQHQIELHLLTSGVLLERTAADVGRSFRRVTISLDAADAALYHEVRGIPALERVEAGVRALRALAPAVPICARATLHRLNFRELPAIIEKARALALDGVSFLAADLASTAFGRRRLPPRSILALTADEVAAFDEVVERTIASFAAEFASGFVIDPPQKLRRLPRYYAALAGLEAFPPVACNAPSFSVVLEANGAVRPCFFHDPIGNVRTEALSDIVKRRLPVFRRALDTATNPVCTRCVCSMNTSWRALPW